MMSFLKTLQKFERIIIGDKKRIKSPKIIGRNISNRKAKTVIRYHQFFLKFINERKNQNKR